MIFHSTYPTVLSASLRLSLLVLLIAFGGSLLAQSKADLQALRNELNKKIAYTQKLIKASKADQEVSFEQLRMLKEQIRYRQQLLNSYEKEIRTINSDISTSEQMIVELERKIAVMKEEYAAMIYQAYKNRQNHDELMYIFAASSFNQAFKRFKFLQEYADYRKRQANEIKDTQAKLEERIVSLEADKASKVVLLDEKAAEAASLRDNKQEIEQVIAQLKSEEDKLKKKQQQQEQERQRINAAIRRIIEEELAAEKKKNDGKYELTPAGKIISAEFEKNKGNFPWPVLRGVITSRFGTQPHPTIPGITIENNGIDISTEAGSGVLAVFGGTVTSVFSIPGAGQNVIITHGAYKTVYTGLTDVTFAKGDQIEMGERIGTVLTVNNKSVSHFEIWKMNSKSPSPQNPELWIRRK